MANCGRRNWQLQLRVGLPMSIQRAAHLWPLRGSRRLGIREGYYGETRMDGVRFVRAFSWPGAIHEGNGTRLLIVDERRAESSSRFLRRCARTFLNRSSRL